MMSDESDSMADTVARATDAWIVGRALRPGDVLAHGLIVHRVERLESGSRFVVTTSSAPLRVVIELPRAGSSYHAKTERLGIWVDSVDRNRRLHEAVAQAVADRIRALEGRNEPEWPTPSRPPVHGATPIFYLTPGHLGDPDDLSLRALQVIASVPIIFVENGKADDLRALMTRFDLRAAEGPGAPEIVELDHDDLRQTNAVERWRAAVAAGLDTCLFGGNEGIPGFCDPGKALVIAAADMRDAVRVRSVGGSSALGHALMRVPSRLRAFEFGGLMHSEAEAGQLTAALALGRLPLVVFSHGSAVRTYLPGMIRQSGLRRGTVHLLCAFTSDEEHAYAIAAAHFVPPGPETLLDYQAVVVVIERGSMGDGTRGTFIERVIAWVRGVLTNRPGIGPQIR